MAYDLLGGRITPRNIRGIGLRFGLAGFQEEVGYALP